MSNARDFQILHLTAELWPYARTGGLGQAVADIAAYEAKHATTTSVLVPLYRVARENAGKLLPMGEPFTVQVGDDTEEVRCWRDVAAPADGPKMLFLDHPASFDREGIYGEGGSDYPDNDRRWAIFSLGALEVAARMQGPRLVLHTHDWHTALASVYLHVTHQHRPELARLPVVLTVHNGGFQGLYGPQTLRRIGLPDWLWSLDWMEWYGQLNYLKGGLKYADMVTTVSPTHAIEMRSEVGGFGLHHVFRALGDRFVGIRNGIDAELWDPATDTELTARYSVDDLAPKAKNKTALQRAWRLPVRARTPVFGMSARLVSQKGLDLIVGSDALRAWDCQFIFLGAGEQRYEEMLANFAATNADRVAINTAFTDRLEHRLLGGADFLLMPSLYEPCGLTQMRAQRYGAPPVARRVGGLADTIIDGVTGFLFDGYTPPEFDRAVRRALNVYADKESYLEQAKAAMRLDFSWAEPVAQYVDCYRRAIAAH